ncbi:MAG: DUF370 domain-containing protein [Candidatus Bipolaricaulia bacterium]
MNKELISIGLESLVRRERVVVIARPDTAPIRRLIKRYKEEGKVIDLTRGRKARAAIITDAGLIILSPLRTKTIAERFLEE